MTARARFYRLLYGLGILFILIAALLAVTLSVIPTWGADNFELVCMLPGDNLLECPDIVWTHAITINASPENIWPWIAQMGDMRGGFYSYTFIENQIARLTGADDYNIVYHNADSIVPEWQNPQPGDEIIRGVLKIAEVQPNEYLLADSVDPEIMGWTWLWRLYPERGGQQTRMVVRFRIDMPGDDNPIARTVMSLGGFIMQRRMIEGIKLRAEGEIGTEPGEGLGIVMWFGALTCGLIAAVLFVGRLEWRQPLLVAASSVVILFALTFVQPPMSVRAALDAMLIAGVWWLLSPPVHRPARRMVNVHYAPGY